MVLQLTEDLARDAEKLDKRFDGGGLAVAESGGTSLQMWLSSEK
jgi:hypothetical protein